MNYVMLGLAGRAGWMLPGEARSVRVARELARAVAAGDEDQAETAALCVSELVTNALAHSRSGLPGGTVMVCFEALARAALFIAVQDDGARPAAGPGGRSGLPGPAESGYGLGIVAAVTTDWGVVPRGDGRSATWCVVPAGCPEVTEYSQDDPGECWATRDGQREVHDRRKCEHYLPLPPRELSYDDLAAAPAGTVLGTRPGAGPLDLPGVTGAGAIVPEVIR